MGFLKNQQYQQSQFCCWPRDPTSTSFKPSKQKNIVPSWWVKKKQRSTCWNLMNPQKKNFPSCWSEWSVVSFWSDRTLLCNLPAIQKRHIPGNSAMVTFLGWWVDVEPLKGWTGDLQRLGDKKVTLNRDEVIIPNVAHPVYKSSPNFLHFQTFFPNRFPYQMWCLPQTEILQTRGFLGSFSPTPKTNTICRNIPQKIRHFETDPFFFSSSSSGRASRRFKGWRWSRWTFRILKPTIIR